VITLRGHLITQSIYRLHCGLDDWGSIPAGAMMGLSLFTTTSTLALESTQPLIQGVLGALTPGVKWLGCEAENSPPPNAQHGA